MSIPKNRHAKNDLTRVFLRCLALAALRAANPGLAGDYECSCRVGVLWGRPVAEWEV
jgi:hypothetical protein